MRLTIERVGYVWGRSWCCMGRALSSRTVKVVGYRRLDRERVGRRREGGGGARSTRHSPLCSSPLSRPTTFSKGPRKHTSTRLPTVSYAAPGRFECIRYPPDKGRSSKPRSHVGVTVHRLSCLSPRQDYGVNNNAACFARVQGCLYCTHRNAVVTCTRGCFVFGLVREEVPWRAEEGEEGTRGDAPRTARPYTTVRHLLHKSRCSSILRSCVYSLRSVVSCPSPENGHQDIKRQRRARHPIEAAARVSEINQAWGGRRSVGWCMGG